MKLQIDKQHLRVRIDEDELAQLLDMEIEILIVRVVVAVSHLHKRDLVF